FGSDQIDGVIPVARVLFPVQHDRGPVAHKADTNARIGFAVSNDWQARGLGDEVLKQQRFDFAELFLEFPSAICIGVANTKPMIEDLAPSDSKAIDSFVEVHE